jgi:hypothetical protein
MVLVKELIGALKKEDIISEGECEPRTMKQAMRIRPLPRFNKETPLFDCLNYFQTGRSHMALVTRGKTMLTALGASSGVSNAQRPVRRPPTVGSPKVRISVLVTCLRAR